MTTAHSKLGELAAQLEQQGADPQRVELVRRAQRFKRSWVEMAEALLRVRRNDAYLDWGYEDFYSYCANELHIRRSTVDKLTASYTAVERHAPEALDPQSNVEVPSYDAADYFAKALGFAPESPGRGSPSVPEAERPEPGDEVVDELRHAVFEEGVPASVLRRRFDPVLFPKPPGAVELDTLEKARSTTRRLIGLLSQIDQLSRETVIHAEDALETLQEELERTIPDMREQLQVQAAASKGAATTGAARRQSRRKRDAAR